MKKKKLFDGVYLLVILLLSIIAAITILPVFIDRARVLYSPQSLTILHAIVSLLVALVTFSIIGDSEALVKPDNKTGFVYQVGGSAAGFAVFFYLLSSGLSSFNTLTVGIINEDGNLVTDKIRVVVSGKTLQFAETSSGFVDFAFLPREDESRRISITSEAGFAWRIVSVSPERCNYPGGRVSGSCEQVEIILAKKNLCLNDHGVISHEVKKIDTKLRIVLERLKEQFQRVSPILGAKLEFSDKVLAEGLHNIEFELSRKVNTERSACEHLSTIESIFNRELGRRAVRSYASCNTILIAKPEEEVKEEFKQCSGT